MTMLIPSLDGSRPSGRLARRLLSPARLRGRGLRRGRRGRLLPRKVETGPSPFISKHSFRTTALIIASALFMEQLDSTVLSTALPTMARSFGSAQYVPGGTLDVTLSLDYLATDITALGITEQIPAGWTFQGVVGAGPGQVGAQGADLFLVEVARVRAVVVAVTVAGALGVDPGHHVGSTRGTGAGPPAFHEGLADDHVEQQVAAEDAGVAQGLVALFRAAGSDSPRGRGPRRPARKPRPNTPTPYQRS